MSSLSGERGQFADGLSAATGLDIEVVDAWVQAENNGGGDHNWLNVSYPGGGRGYSGVPATGGRFSSFQSVGDAVTETAYWVNHFSNYAGVREAIAGGDPQAERAAIIASPWDRLHYGGGVRFPQVSSSGGGVANAGQGAPPGVVGPVETDTGTIATRSTSGGRTRPGGTATAAAGEGGVWGSALHGLGVFGHAIASPFEAAAGIPGAIEHVGKALWGFANGFLRFVAFIIDPVNWLRLVELIVGLSLIGAAFAAYLKVMSQADTPGTLQEVRKTNAGFGGPPVGGAAAAAVKAVEK